MAGPWEDYQDPYKKEKNLNAFVAGPNLAQETEEAELKPWAMDGLDEAIKNAPTPWGAAALQKTKDEQLARRATQQPVKDDGPWNDYKSGPWDDYKSSKEFGDDFVNKYINSPLSKLDNTAQGYLPSRIEAVGGAVKGIGEALASGAGMAQSLLGPVSPIHTGPTLPGPVMKNALAQGQTWARALTSILPQELQDTLSSPAAEAGNSLAGIAFAPLQEGINTLREAGHPDLADAAELALGIGGAGAIVAGFKGGKKAVKVPPEEFKLPETTGPEQPPQFVPDVVEPQHQLDLRSTDHEPWQIDENGMPYTKEVSDPIQRDLFSPEARTPDDVIREKSDAALSKPGFMRDPLDQLAIKAQEENIAKITKPLELGNLNKPVEKVQGEVWKNYAKDVIGHEDAYSALSRDVNDIVVNANNKGVLPKFNEFADAIQHQPISLFDKFITGKIADLVKDVPIKVVDFDKAPDGLPSKFQNGYSGFYDGKSIWINKKSIKGTVDLIHVLNHEGIHAATAAWLDAHPKDPKAILLWDLLAEAKKSTRDTMGMTKDYGLTSPHEFLAEMSNPTFVDHLSKLKLPQQFIDRLHQTLGTKANSIRSAWSGFVQILSKILGFEPKETNALAASFHLFDHIIRDRTPKNIAGDYSTLAEMKQNFGNKSQSVYSQLDKSSQKQTVDLRPFKDFIRESMPKDAKGEVKPIPQSEDIGRIGRIGNVAAVASQYNYSKLGGRVLKNFISRIQEYANQGSKNYKEMSSLIEDFGNLTRTSTKKITKTWVDFDGIYNDELTSKNLQWPTSDMLASKGLNPKEINVYQQMTRAMDKSYELIESAFKKMGLEPPTRIPGYFPHFWVGAWKVLVSDATNKPVALRAFTTRLQAQRYMKGLDGEKLQGELQVPRADVKANDLVSTMVDAQRVYGNSKSGLSQAILTSLKNLDTASKRGIIKDVLERDKNLKGHLADISKIDPDSMVDFNRGNTNLLISAFQRHLESVSQFWTNTHIAADMGGEFHDAIYKGIFDDAPNTKAAINEFIARTTGHPINHFPFIDESLRAAAIKAGLPPSTFHTLGKQLGGMLAFLKLVVPNPRFIISNVFQPLTNIADISLAHMERVVAGDKQGDLVGALSTFMKESLNLQTGKGSPILEDAIKWARDNNKISVFQADHINPLKNADDLAKARVKIFEALPTAIEEKGRAVTFLTHYMYYRTVMPRLEALHAAAMKMDTAMGNYERMNSPGMYTDFGILGQSLRPFGLLRNVYYGKAFQAINLVSETFRNAKSPNDLPKIAAAAVPITLMMSQYLVMAGATGMLGAAEWDYLARQYNALFNPEYPMLRPGEVLRKYGAKDWMVYGVLGKALGWDIGPSVNAPAMTELGSVPAASALWNLTILTKAALDQVTNNGADMDQVKAASRALVPNIMAGWLDERIAQLSNGGQVMPKSSSMEGGTYRTPEEAKTYKMFGARALTEVDRTQIDQLYKYENGLDSTWKQKQVSKIVDAMLGLSPLSIAYLSDGKPDASKLIMQAITSNRGFDADSLNKAIEVEMLRRVTTQHLRDLQGISNTKNVAEQGNNMNQMNILQRQGQ